MHLQPQMVLTKKMMQKKVVQATYLALQSIQMQSSPNRKVEHELGLPTVVTKSGHLDPMVATVSGHLDPTVAPGALTTALKAVLPAGRVVDIADVLKAVSPITVADQKVVPAVVTIALKEHPQVGLADIAGVHLKAANPDTDVSLQKVVNPDMDANRLRVVSPDMDVSPPTGDLPTDASQQKVANPDMDANPLRVVNPDMVVNLPKADHLTDVSRLAAENPDMDVNLLKVGNPDMVANLRKADLLTVANQPKADHLMDVDHRETVGEHAAGLRHQLDEAPLVMALNLIAVHRANHTRAVERKSLALDPVAVLVLDGNRPEQVAVAVVLNQARVVRAKSHRTARLAVAPTKARH